MVMNPMVESVKKTNPSEKVEGYLLLVQFPKHKQNHRNV